ncbi:hypothetical protein KUV57_11395 [Epibacterium sp. DP7N7-1]|nr:hypothetical protein [Epibacterium sp. DP7N7-1]
MIAKDIFEEKLAAALKAQSDEAVIWNQAQASAYQYALEMLSHNDPLQLFNEKLSVATRGDASEVPFGMDERDAVSWHGARVEAFRHIIDTMQAEPNSGPAMF